MNRSESEWFYWPIDPWPTPQNILEISLDFEIVLAVPGG